MLKRWLGALLLLILVCGVLGPFAPILGTFFVLLLGWPWYLARVVGQLTINWGGVLTGVVCLVLLGAGLHAFCGWLYGQLQEGHVWQKRWTVSLLGAVMLMFVAGIAAVGMTHQTVWLMNSPEP